MSYWTFETLCCIVLQIKLEKKRRIRSFFPVLCATQDCENLRIHVRDVHVFVVFDLFVFHEYYHFEKWAALTFSIFFETL